MRGDFTRFTFNPQKRYTGVHLQQGRVLLDADWNEQIDIDFYQRQAVALTYLGTSGAPKVGGGFQITQGSGTDLTISPGRFYVNGLLCERFASAEGAGTTYLTQEQLPAPPPLGSPGMGPGYYLVYLDVWTRHVTVLEDPRLRELALNGPDTTTRTQTMAQVKLLPVSTLPPSGTRVDIATYLPVPGLQLKAHAIGGDALDTDAILPQGTGYQRVDNCLYRVEIHQGGVVGNTTNPVTFKWSRDNGSCVAAWDRLDGNVLTISYPGRDDDLGFAIGNWVELTDDNHELLGQPGQLVQITNVEGPQLTINPAGATILYSSYPRNPKVRRWDMTSATVPLVTAGSWLPLESGVEVCFADAGAFCQTGDYWVIPARAATRNIEWPQRAGAPASQPPMGVAHAYAPLAQFQYDGTNINNLTDLRLIFPSAIDITNLVQSHQHTGGTDGTPIPRAGIVNAAIDGTKIDPASQITMQTLNVTGAVSLSGPTTMSAPVSVTGGLNPTTALTVGGTSAAVTVAGALNPSTALTIGGSTAAVTVAGALNPSNPLTIGGASAAVTVAGVLNPSTPLTIGGTSAAVTVAGALNPSNPLTIGGASAAVTVAGALNPSTALTLGGSSAAVTVAGALNPSTALTIGGNSAAVTVAGTLTAQRNVTVSGTLNPSTNLTIGNAGSTNPVTVNPPLTANSTVTVTGTLNPSTNLTMGGASATVTVNGTLNPSTNLTIGSAGSTNPVTVNPPLMANSTVTVTGTLNPSTALTIGNTNSTTPVTLNAPLTANGTCTFMTAVNPANNLTLGSSTASVTVPGTLNANGGWSAGANSFLNTRYIYLRDDNYHGLAFGGRVNPFGSSTVDGPILFGFAGGVLGTTSGGAKVALSWDLNQNVALNGNLTTAGNMTQTGTDFCINNVGRSGTHTGTKRALVHDVGDKLTINFAGDYTGGVAVNSAFSAVSKNFSIPHPLKPSTHSLVHSCLEGPEVAVYYRGEAQLENGVAAITLPSYFEALTSKEGRTVLLTLCCDDDDDGPISQLAASKVCAGGFRVRAIDRNNPSQRFYWEVKAVRADQPPLEVEPLAAPIDAPVA